MSHAGCASVVEEHPAPFTPRHPLDGAANARGCSQYRGPARSAIPGSISRHCCWPPWPETRIRSLVSTQPSPENHTRTPRRAVLPLARDHARSHPAACSRRVHSNCDRSPEPCATDACFPRRRWRSQPTEGSREVGPRRTIALREKRAPETKPSPLRQGAGARRSQSVGRRASGGGWRESSKRSSAPAGAGAPFRGKDIVGSRPTGRLLSGNAIVARGARLGGGARLSLGDSASDRLSGAAEIRTPAFRRSTRARVRVRALAAISAPAGWGPTHASTR